MTSYQNVVRFFKTKTDNCRPVDFLVYILLGFLIIYGFVAEFIFSMNFSLHSDSVETGIVSMEIWRHHNFLLDQFYLPSADPLYFSESITFQLFPQIFSNFSPLILKLVSFFIFLLTLAVFGYIIYIISKKLVCVLIFLALMLNLTPSSYLFFNGPTNHVATIFFIGLFIIFCFYQVYNKLIPAVIFIILLNLIVYSDSLIIIWFIIPLLLYNVSCYKQLTKQKTLFIASALITSGLTYFYKTYLNPNLFNGYSQLNFVNFEEFIVHLSFFFKGLILLLNGNIYLAISNTQKNTFTDISLIVLFSLVLITFLYSLKRIEKKHFYFFVFFSGITLGFIYIFFTTITVNIDTTRYLTFLGVLIFVILSISCKSNRFFSLLVIFFIIINAITNFSAITTPQYPNKEQLEMIDFLEKNQLNTGFGDYWDSNIITYLSNEQVIIRPIIVNNDQIIPFFWVSAKKWYTSNSEKYFILVKSDGIFLNTDSMKQYLVMNTPNKVLRYNNYYIYIFNQRPIISPTIIYHQIGHVIEEKGENYVEISSNEGSGLALYGPYKKFGPGKFLVNFDINIDNSTNNTRFTNLSFCKIDVSSQNGKLILAQKELYVNNLTQQNGSTLEFTLMAPEFLEFRVWSENVLPFRVNAEPTVSKL
jgi:hypothetical protein